MLNQNAPIFINIRGQTNAVAIISSLIPIFFNQISVTNTLNSSIWIVCKTGAVAKIITIDYFAIWRKGRWYVINPTTLTIAVANHSKRDTLAQRKVNHGFHFITISTASS